MFFDARKAKGLAPGEYYAIDGCPGLRLLARASRKSWVYRYRSPVSDKLKQILIGAWPAVSPAEAVSIWRGLRDRRAAGEDPAADKRQAKFEVRGGPDPEYTLGQMVEDYIEGHLKKNRQARGAHATGLRLKRAIKKHAGMHAKSVGRQFVHDLIDGMSATPVAALSVKAEMAAAWNYAMNAGTIPEDLPNWWEAVKFPSMRSKGQKREGQHKGTAKRVLRSDELGLLFTDQMRLFSPLVQDFLTIQQWTITRGGEICQMRVRDITREGSGLWWTIPKELNKLVHHELATDQRVPLVGRAAAAVERRLAQAKEDGVEWLFPSKSRRGEVTHVKQAYMQSKVHYRQPYSACRKDHVRERLRVTRWSPHDLRRTGRTMLAAMGVPEEIGEALLGHVKPGVVGVYNLYRYDPERLTWLTRLSERLEEICAASEPPCSEAVTK